MPRLPEQPLQNQGSGEPKGMRILVMKMVTMIMSKRCKNTGPGSLRIFVMNVMMRTMTTTK